MDSRKHCRQRSIWNGGTVSAWGATVVTKPRQTSEKRLQNQDDGTHCSDPTLSVDRILDATNVRDKNYQKHVHLS